MIDKAYWRNEIRASLTYFKIKRTEHRECAIMSIQVNVIGAVLTSVKNKQGFLKELIRDWIADHQH